MGDILQTIRDQSGSLSRREQLVADAILADPEAVIAESVVDLAARVGVSQPTVIRFCRSVGCTGFRDFKLTLAQAMVHHRPVHNADVTAEDTLGELTRKVVAANIAAISALPEQLDGAQMERALSILGQARRIIFFGMGGSGIVAQDARHKFLRFETPCEVYTDPIMLRMAVAGRGQNAALVLISTTGRTAEVVEAARIAGMSGFSVICLTEPDTPLARVADVPIVIEPSEDLEVLIPMASRLAHLTIVDMLATGIALGRNEDVKIHQARMKAIIRGTRLPQRRPNRRS